MPVIPLRVHSHWSLLAGVPSIEEIVAHAQAGAVCPRWRSPMSTPSTARSSLCSAAALRRCSPSSASISLLKPAHSLTLLAQNMNGYANLCRLVTRLQAAADREAALARGLALTDLADHTSGADRFVRWAARRPLDRSLHTRSVFLALDGAADVERIALADQLGVPGRGRARYSLSRALPMRRAFAC